jgi:hypothetical protein
MDDMDRIEDDASNNSSMPRKRIYELRPRDGLRCHDTRIKFHKDWYRHSKVEGGGGGFTGTQNVDQICR